MAEKFSLTAQLKLQAPTNTNQVIDQIRRNLRGVNVDVSARGSAKTAKEINKVNKELRGATNQAQNFAAQLGIATKRAAGLALATRVVSAVTSRFKNAVDEAIAFEREMIKISQVTGKTLTQLKGLSQEVSRLSTTLGISSASLVTVSRQLSQAGFAAADLKVALSALAKTELAPTFDDITRTTEGAIALFNQFGKGAAALEGQLGAINAVAGKFAVESGDLIGVVRRVGGVFSAAGGSLEELLALFTSVRATTRESAESIATGLRTILTRIQRPRTIKFLEDLGLELTNAEGRFVGPIKAVEQLNKAFANMPTGSLEFLRVSEEIAGFRQIGKVIPLIQQFAVAQEALKVAAAGQDSLAKDAAAAQQGLGVQIEKVRQEYLALVREFTESSSFKVMVSLALSFASALAKVLSSLKDILPLLGAVAAVKIFQGGGIGGILGGLKGVTKRNQGGPIGFARGGVVPGSGNRDTVPAMLTPGEFVIRKSSVGKIGAGTLAQMNENKFAKGGIVTKPDEIGMFVLNPSKGKDADKTIKSGSMVDITNPAALSALGQGVGKQGTSQQLVNSQLFLNSTQAVQKEILGDNFKGLANTGKVGQSSFNKGDGKARGDRLKAAMDDQGVKDRLNTLQTSGKGGAGGLSSQTSAPAVNATSVPLSGAVSTFFTAKRDVKKSSAISQSVSNATKQGMEDAIATSVAEASAVLQGIDPIDASEEKVFQRSLSNLFSKGGGAIESIEGYIFEGLIAGLTGASIAGKSANFDFNIFAKIQKERLADLFGDSQIDKLVKADAKRTYSPSLLGTGKGSIGSKIGNDINDGDFRGVMFAAKGGAARGTDTVPAMLTPGEFVINKKAASNIGSAGLNKMNKQGVTGFNKGGAVGFVQKFANGGEPNPIKKTQQTFDFDAGANVDMSVLQSNVSGAAKKLAEVKAEAESSQKVLNELNAEALALSNSSGEVRSRYNNQAATLQELETQVNAEIAAGKAVVEAQRRQVEAGDAVAQAELDLETSISEARAGKQVVKEQQETSHRAQQKSSGFVSKTERGGFLGFADAEKTRKQIKSDQDKKVASKSPSAFTTPDEAIQHITATTGGGGWLGSAGAPSTTAGQPPSDDTAILVKQLDQLINETVSIKEILKEGSAIQVGSDGMSDPTKIKAQALMEKDEKQVAAHSEGIKKERESRKERQSNLVSLQDKRTKELESNKTARADRDETVNKAKDIKQRLKGGVFSDVKRAATGDFRSDDDLKEELAALKVTYKEQTKTIKDSNTTGKSINKEIKAQGEAIKASKKTTLALNNSRAKYQARIDETAQSLGKPARGTSTSTKVADTKTTKKMKAQKKGSVDRDKGGDGDGDEQKKGMGNFGKIAALQALPMLVDQFGSSVDENGNQVRSVVGEVIAKASQFGVILAGLGVDLNASSLKKFFGTGPESLGGQLKNGAAGLKSMFREKTQSIGDAIQKSGRNISLRAKDAIGPTGRGLGRKFGKTRVGKGMGGAGRLLGKGAGMLGRAGGAVAGGIGAVGGGVGSALATLAGPVALVAGGLALLSTGLNALFDAEGKYQQAVKDGNVAKAKENAILKETPGLIQALNKAVPGAAEAFLHVMTAFGGPTVESVKALAGAAALASKADKDKAKAADIAKEALQDFTAGTKTAAEALGAGFTSLLSQKAAIDANRKARFANEKNKSFGDGAVARDALSLLSFGMVESSSAKNSRIDRENEALTADTKERQRGLLESSKGLIGGVMADSGGIENFKTLDEFLAAVDDGTEEFQNVYEVIGALNGKQQEKLKKIFEEEAKIRRDNIAAAKALNLGLSGVNARANAVSSSLARLKDNQNGTANEFSNSASILRDAISSSAAFVNPADLQQSKEVLANTLRGFGADEGQVSKAVGTVDVLNKAQSGFEAAFEASKTELAQDGKAFSGTTVLESLSRNLGAQLEASGADPAVMKQLQDSFKALSDDEKGDLKKAMDDKDFGKIREILFKPLQDSVDGAARIMEQRGAQEKELLDLMAKRADAERKSIDIQLEAAKIIESVGGKKLTTPEQTRARVAQFNTLAGTAGVSGLKTGSADDIRRVGRGITDAADKEAGIQAAGGSGTKGGALTKAQDGLIQLTRQRIQLLRQELDIIKQKNALERSAIDALLAGDAEGFFEQQGAAAAASAIRSGNTALLQSLDQSDISKGLASLEGQLSSSELFAAARTAGLSQRQAQVFSGTTAEEQAVTGQIQDTARALAEQGQNAARLQELAINTAEIVVKHGTFKLDGQAAQDLSGGANGGANAAASTAVAEGVTQSATEVTTAATQVATATEQLTKQVATMQQASNEVTHSHTIQPFQVQITGGDGLSSETIQVVIEDVFTNKIIPRITHQGAGSHKLSES